MLIIIIIKSRNWRTKLFFCFYECNTTENVGEGRNVDNNAPRKRKACTPRTLENRRTLTNCFCKTCDTGMCDQHAVFTCQKCNEAKDNIQDDGSD
jgi:hypothetical protein